MIIYWTPQEEEGNFKQKKSELKPTYASMDEQAM